jgi:membrane protein implicated in regulation of membrane protease activity
MWPFIWLGVMVLMLIVEASTAALTTVWFAFGALMALVASTFSVWPVQLFVFVAVSALSLWLLRPYLRRSLTVKKIPTNADRVIDQVGIVVETINNLDGTGIVQVERRTWTARAASGLSITKGAHVRILSIEGIKVIVEECQLIADSEEIKV